MGRVHEIERAFQQVVIGFRGRSVRSTYYHHAYGVEGRVPLPTNCHARDSQRLRAINDVVSGQVAGLPRRQREARICCGVVVARECASFNSNRVKVVDFFRFVRRIFRVFEHRRLSFFCVCQFSYRHHPMGRVNLTTRGYKSLGRVRRFHNLFRLDRVVRVKGRQRVRFLFCEL